MNLGLEYNGSTVKWIYKNPIRITKSQAFLKNVVHDKLNWLFVLISVFLVSARHVLPARDVMLGVLVLLVGLPSSYANTMDTFNENNSVYGYTEDFIFKENDKTKEHKLIPFSDIHEVEVNQLKGGNFNLYFNTVYVGKFTKGLTKARIESFKNVHISQDDLEYLKSKVTIES